MRRVGGLRVGNQQTRLGVSYTRQMLIGGLLALPGAIAYGVANSAGVDDALRILYLLAAVGAAAFLIGVLRWLLSGALGDRAGSVDTERRHDRAIIRSLLAVAAADGELKESELNVIENYASKIADITISDQLVRELFEEMTAHPVSIRDELTAVTTSMGDAERVTIYQGAALVAHCVPPLGPKERAALDQISAALKLPPEATKHIEQRAEAAFADSGVASTVKYWLGLKPE